MTQFRNGYESNLDAYCMKQYGLNTSLSDSFSSLAAPRVADVFLESLDSVSKRKWEKSGQIRDLNPILIYAKVISNCVF